MITNEERPTHTQTYLQIQTRSATSRVFALPATTSPLDRRFFYASTVHSRYLQPVSKHRIDLVGSSIIRWPQGLAPALRSIFYVYKSP
jgi:hypothetical protein